MFYLAIFVALVALRYGVGRVATRTRMYPCLLVLLFIFSAFRYEVGCDWSGYLNQYLLFQSAALDQLVGSREPLWIWTIGTINSLGLAYPWLNVVSSAVFFAGMHSLARRQSDPFGFIVLLFPILIINMPMSAIRQGVAIGLIGFALTAFIDRRLVRFLVLIGTAGLIHSSAITFLLMAPLVRGGFSKQRIALAGVLAVPGLALLLQTDSADLAVDRYVDTGRDAAGALFRLLILTLTGVFFFSTLRKKWKQHYPADFKLVFVSSLVMLGLSILTPLSSVIGDRIGYYFIPVQAMVFARIPFLRLKQSRAIWVFLPYAGLLLVFGVWTATSWHFDQCYVPYKTWIFGYPSSRH